MIIRLFIAVSGIGVAVMGVLTLIDYWLHVPYLYLWLDGGSAMAPNTAMALILIGIDLILLGASHKPWDTAH